MLAAKLPYRYIKTELNKLLDSMVILIDTREKKTEHITDYLKDKGVFFHD